MTGVHRQLRATEVVQLLAVRGDRGLGGLEAASGERAVRGGRGGQEVPAVAADELEGLVHTGLLDHVLVDVGHPGRVGVQELRVALRQDAILDGLDHDEVVLLRHADDLLALEGRDDLGLLPVVGLAQQELAVDRRQELAVEAGHDGSRVADLEHVLALDAADAEVEVAVVDAVRGGHVQDGLTAVVEGHRHVDGVALQPVGLDVEEVHAVDGGDDLADEALGELATADHLVQAADLHGVELLAGLRDAHGVPHREHAREGLPGLVHLVLAVLLDHLGRDLHGENRDRVGRAAEADLDGVLDELHRLHAAVERLLVEGETAVGLVDVEEGASLPVEDASRQPLGLVVFHLRDRLEGDRGGGGRDEEGQGDEVRVHVLSKRGVPFVVSVVFLVGVTRRTNFQRGHRGCGDRFLSDVLCRRIRPRSYLPCLIPKRTLDGVWLKGTESTLPVKTR